MFLYVGLMMVSVTETGGVKVKVLPMQSTKALRVGRVIALPHLRPRH